MGSGIRLLPTEVIDLIAAGEVIDSLAAVVRELVENALDAGASRVVISLWPDQGRVRVADNGTGMSLTNLRQAAAPHSTSKIGSKTDLQRITSLGFRGEALHSLARLAQLEICSCMTRGSGWQVRYGTQGEVLEHTALAMAPGTVVTVSNLFGNWPDRQQALPSPGQQIRAVQTLLHNLALCHPQVTWQVEQSNRPWFTLYPGTTACQILPQLLRTVQEADLREVNWYHAQAVTDVQATSGLYLLLGLPDRCHRRRPDWVRVAINGRCVQFPELEQTLISALRRTLPRDRHPVCFLHLHLSPDQVDWHRHPAKAEVYVKHLDRWQIDVTQAVNAALRLGGLGGTDLSTDRVRQLVRAAELPGSYQTASKQTLGSEAEVGPPQPGQSLANSALVGSDEELTRSGMLAASSETSLIPLKAVGQIHNTYILAEHPDGVWLIEQHIAHERVLYEQLCAFWQVVPLEPAIVLNHLSQTQVERLQALGLAIESFGDQLWAVRNAPKLLAQRADCADALLELSQVENIDAALVTTACRSALRNGTPLDLAEMQTLLDQWQRTRNPRTCPHGRPIYLNLAESSLSRFFRRHWVIGKSHGI